LVNNVQTPGVYLVEFNALVLPSGIYYYKLQTGNYESVKQMLLIK